MLEEILAHLKNWFLYDYLDGHFVISDGRITLTHVTQGQYFRIIGSRLNDGVYKYGEESLTDEEFDGSVWALAVPKRLLDLAEEISTWQEKNGDVSTSPYTSESFGGYSYSTANDNASGNAVTWQSAFRCRLNVWRKI